MPQYGTALRPQKRLRGKPGLRKNAVLPTVIIKNEDLGPLADWETKNQLTIHVWHVFYDLAFGLSLDRAKQLINDGLIEPTIQTFQAPSGATTRKALYKFYYQYAYALGEAITEPTLIADSIVDRNGHILPYVKFDGGSLRVTDEAIGVLDEAVVARGLR
jgi:hypothetical protein